MHLFSLAGQILTSFFFITKSPRKLEFSSIPSSFPSFSFRKEVRTESDRVYRQVLQKIRYIFNPIIAKCFHDIIAFH